MEGRNISNINWTQKNSKEKSWKKLKGKKKDSVLSFWHEECGSH